MEIRELVLEDTYRMLEWMKNKDITQYFRFDASNACVESVTSFIIEAKDSQTSCHRAVVDSQNRYMGTVSLKNIDFENNSAEYAISLHMDAQGKGYAKFATDNILAYAFDELKLNRIYLNVLSENKRAIRFYEKYGFIYEGESIDHIVINGKYHSLKWYRLLSREWWIK